MEVGPKDLDKKSVMLVRRDTGIKEECLIESAPKRVKEILDNIQTNLFETALKRREESNQTVNSWKEFEKGIENGGYVFAHWCGEEACEADIKKKTKAVSRFIPLKGKRKMENIAV